MTSDHTEKWVKAIRHKTARSIQLKRRPEQSWQVCEARNTPLNCAGKKERLEAGKQRLVADIILMNDVLGLESTWIEIIFVDPLDFVSIPGTYTDIVCDH